MLGFILDTWEELLDDEKVKEFLIWQIRMLFAGIVCHS